jgi:hypothetical protein
MQKVAGLILRKTEYLDSHHWTNEVRCVYKNVGYTLRSHEYDGTQLRRFNACHAERQMALFAYKHQFARDKLVNDVDLLGLSPVHSPQRLKWAAILVSTFYCASHCLECCLSLGAPLSYSRWIQLELPAAQS